MRRIDHRAAHPRSAAHAHDTALFVALERTTTYYDPFLRD